MTEPKIRSVEEITKELKEKYPPKEVSPGETIIKTKTAKDLRIEIENKLKEKTELQEKAKEQLLKRSQDEDYGRRIHKIDTELTILERKEKGELRKEREQKIIARYNPNVLKKYGITKIQLLRFTVANLNNFSDLLVFEKILDFLKRNDPEGLKLLFPDGKEPNGRRGMDQAKVYFLKETWGDKK